MTELSSGLVSQQTKNLTKYTYGLVNLAIKNREFSYVLGQ